jgi:CHAT domain-containing protein
LLSLIAGGCRTDWPGLYADARKKFDHSRLQADRHEADVAADIAQKGMRNSAQREPIWSYKFRVLTAEIIVTQKPDEALELLAPPPPPELSSGEFACRRKITQGLVYARRKDFARAKLSLDEAARYVAASTPELMATIAFDQAYVAQLQNDNHAAEERYDIAITLAQRYGLSSLECNAHIHLGIVLMDQELYDRSIGEFNASLSLAHSAQAPAYEHFALGNLGWSYIQVGDFESAATALTRAAEIAAQVKDVSQQELWLRDLGILFYVQNNFSQAETYYQKSLALAQQRHDKNSISINYHNLAQLELKRGRIDKAEDYNKQAYIAKGLAAGDHSDLYLLLTSAEIAQVRKEFAKAEEYLKAVIDGASHDSSLRWQAESDLANLYVAENETAKADEMFEQALRTVEEARDRTKREDRRISILDAWPFYDDYIRFLVHQNNAAKALQIAEFSRGRTLAEAFNISQAQKPGRLQISAAQSFSRKRDQAILAYWISEQESYLWVLNGAQFQLFRLPDKQKIDFEIDAYSREIREHADTQGSAHGQTLYEMLVKPAEKFLPLNEKVIIVPNRNLYKLNFETLVVPGKKPHYWIEDAVLENASSIALLAETKRRPIAGLKKLLLMGAPVEVTDEFPTLRFAGDEIKAVGRHFSRAQETIVAGKDATPSAYRALHPGDYQFIHLVTHGTPNQVSPLDSAIILSMDEDKSFKLYARNIKDIRPLRADLVTISACYGAAGKTYSGEGLVGLAWAFMRAGSHQVIAALWDINDSVMPQLMDDFYSELDRHKSAAEALHFAKLAVLHSKDFHRKPYYWASLQLYTGS